ncbi:MAG: DUF4321 domain-containing protein, partial [candidate division WOR-3 bacterium]|nr:DUF4321 domain-containing protein [candidate division WOR-3 bacterium]
MAAKRRLSTVIIGIIIGGIIGSALSHFLGSIFPPGPVKGFFFNALKIGFSTVHINLGFVVLSFGLFFNITILTIVFVFLMIYLLYKL